MSNAPSERNTAVNSITGNESTALQRCVQDELKRYFEMLDGENPSSLHRLVTGQVESALFAHVMEECRGNQSRAAQWLDISRGTLRGKLPQLTHN